MTVSEYAINMLHEGMYTCVITNGSDTHTSHERGVRPLVRLLEDGVLLKGYFAADKVVGAAAAYLYVLLDVSFVYADVMSSSALLILEGHGISVSFANVAESIINRKKDGPCPMEDAVKDSLTPDDAYEAILKKLSELSN